MRKSIPSSPPSSAGSLFRALRLCLHSKIRLVALLSVALSSLGLVGALADNRTHEFVGQGSSTERTPASLTTAPFAQSSRSSDGIWQEIEANRITNQGERGIIPQVYRTVHLNKDVLQDLLGQAPMEFTDAARNTKVVMTLPLPDGRFDRFRIEESPIMAPELAAKFPEIKTYHGQGIDDRTATIRFDVRPTGFHAQVISTQGTSYVDPYAKGDTENYISYFKRDFRRDSSFECLVGANPETGAGAKIQEAQITVPLIVPPNGDMLRTYRLALAATGEYTIAAGGTVPLAMARMTTSLNRVNGIYERELALRMTLVANNDLLIYTDPATDGYSNDVPADMMEENHDNLEAVIGELNYDIGHVFGTGPGGTAAVRSTCDEDFKGWGVTGLPNPVGDSFDVDFVAHEMGHQHGGLHTFNTTSGSCLGFRMFTSAYEPGSGSTPMSYVGTCAPSNLQPNADDYFHVRSLETMLVHMAGDGNCAVPTATGNTPPTLGALANFTIPRNTPFALTASASDINGDAVTYAWEEYDPPGMTGTSPPESDADGVARPIFRSYPPTVSPTRTFPSLPYILNNANVPPATYNCGLPDLCITGESLPNITRNMSFQVTARDNRDDGGGIVSALMQVSVSAGAGPFVVTAPNTGVSIPALSLFNVTWNVAGTTAAPVNAADVKISLSTDGGNTFPTVVLASTPNDGSEMVFFLPTQQTSTARIKVEAVGNIFFDISDTNFTITAPTAAPASISGRVTTPDGAPLAGVTMNLSGARTARVISDSNGNYRFNNIETDNFYIVNPSLVNYHFSPADRAFSLLANITDAVFTATRGAVIGGNAIDTAEYFVRQHYLDFLGREPDESGFNFWSDQILGCGSDAGCIERRTINVSAAYFLSIEFQETGGLVDGLYRASYNRRPRYAEFMPDTRTVAQGVVVGQGDWAGLLLANKQAFVAGWVQRPAFEAAYGGLSNESFVDTLISHTGVSFSQGEREALVRSLGSGSSRAEVLRQIAQNRSFVSAKRNSMFVMMEYFGYLRRDPDESGYQFWLNKLNQFGGNFEQAEMVKAFIISSEYRQRFGQ